MVVWVGNGLMRGLEAHTTGLMRGLETHTTGLMRGLEVHTTHALIMQRESRSNPPINATRNLQSAVCCLLIATRC